MIWKWCRAPLPTTSIQHQPSTYECKEEQIIVLSGNRSGHHNTEHVFLLVSQF
jgi:hypothetical protein